MTLVLWRVLAFLIARYELIPAPNGSRYLSRWHFPTWLARRFGCSYLFLHRFHQSDPDRGWHNHPYEWCESKIIRGAYTQETLLRFQSGGKIVTDIFRKSFVAGHVNRITNQYHSIRLYNEITIQPGNPRVVLRPREAWTLFRAGPKHGRSWGFMSYGGRFTPANEPARRNGSGPL